MYKHPNEELIARLYDHFAKGEFEAVLAMCDDNITFSVPGQTPLSGIYTKAGFMELIGKVWEISGGTFRETAHRIIANDNHGTVLLDHYLTRNGQEFHHRVNHIWEIRDGRFTKFEEWAGDEAAFNASWS